MAAILAFFVGVLAAHGFAALPSYPWLAVAAVAALLCGSRLRFAPAAFLAGLAWTLIFAAARLSDELPRALEGRDLLMDGVIEALPEKRADGMRFEFEVVEVLQPSPAHVPRHIRLNWHRPLLAPSAGERWRLRVRLKRPHGYFNPGGSDQEQWLFAQNLRAVGYVREDAENRRLAEAVAWRAPQAWRQGLRARMAEVLAGHPMAGAIEALVMGADDEISREQWEVFKSTGTLHLIAISGAHISLVAGLVFWLAQRAWARWGSLRISPPKIAALAALTAAAGYSALAGFAIPTQRALLMIALVMPALIRQRNLRPARTLALALFAVSAYDPPAVLSPGFWLSFVAVALIVSALSERQPAPHRPTPEELENARPAARALAGLARAARTEALELWKINWHIFLGLAPLTLFFFQRISWISPLANLLAAPLIGLLLTPWCLLGALLLTFHPPAGGFLLRAAADLLQAFWPVLDSFARFADASLRPEATPTGLQPLLAWRAPAPPWWTLIFALPGAFLLLAPKGMPARWLGWVLLLPALTVHPPKPAEGDFRLTLLDVGQGLASVAETRNHILVFDAGARYPGGFSLGEAVVAPFLRERGAEKIDALIVSHGDNDHIGGAFALIERFRIDAAYSSVPQQLPWPGAQACRAGQSWEWDGVRFEMLSPIVHLGSDNDGSCVLKIASAKGSALLTGDIESLAERILVERAPEKLQAEVLIAPHHGSNTSSTAEFLERVRPRYVLIPAGYRNRFRFPHPKALARYAAIGAQVFDTAKAGAIEYRPGAAPSEWRGVNGKYWNDRDAP
jgi:competence protein ComEC